MGLLDRPEFDDPSDHRRAGPVFDTLMLCMTACAAVIVTQLVLPDTRIGLLYTVPTVAVYLVALHQLRRGRIDRAAWITVGFLNMMLSIMALGGGGFGSGAAQLVALSTVTGGLMLGARAGGLLTVWGLLVQASVLVLGDSTRLLPTTIDETATLRWITMVQTGLLGLLVTRSVAQLQKANAIAHEHAESLAIAIESSEQARRDADEANDAKSRFLANMSHELRTPLNAVLGYSEILMEDLDEPTMSEDANRIHRAGSHLLSLIDDILDMAKVEAGKMDLHLEPVDVADLLRDVMQTVKPTAAHGENELVLDLAPDLPELWLDNRKTRQIVMNLLSNACKFTEIGTIRVVAVRNDRGITIAVSDTGRGIPQNKLATLFQPFVQAHDPRRSTVGGTGLGLTLSRHFAEMMHGRLDAASKYGQGSTFTLALPDLSVWANAADPGVESLVLCIDDDIATLDTIARTLRRNGYRTARAMTVEQGLAHAVSSRVGVLVTSSTLPDGTGWDAIAQIRTLQPDVPAILLTDGPVAPGPEPVSARVRKPVRAGAMVRLVEETMGTEVANYGVVEPV